MQLRVGVLSAQIKRHKLNTLPASVTLVLHAEQHVGGSIIVYLQDTQIFTRIQRPGDQCLPSDDALLRRSARSAALRNCN
jgi:hypothetical protein